MESSQKVKGNGRSPRGAAIDRISQVRLTERDAWILEGLAQMRFLTTSQLARLYFENSRWSANKRLRKLLDSGLVKVWVRSLSQDNVYSLTRKGLEAFDEAKLDLEQKVRLPRDLDGNLDHLLAINDVRIATALGLSGTNGDILWWKSDWELRASSREKLIPDAIFMIRWGEGHEQAYALELDNQSKSPGNFLKKIVAYVSRKYQPQNSMGLTDSIILVVGKDPKWLKRYRSLTGEVGLRMRIWFTTLDELKGKSVEDAVWKAGNGEQKYSLRDLSFYPYGKEAKRGETDGFTES
jgi:Replication-relaxation